MILMLTLFGTTTAQCRSQERESKALLDAPITLVLPETNVANALNSLSNLAQIPIGFVSVSGENDKPRSIHLRVRGTVRDVLNQIVTADNRYKWQQVEASINVVPANAQSVDLSELVITSLTINEVHISDVGPAILDSPGIRARLEILGKKPTGFIYIGPAFRDSKISIAFSNTTIRCALNEILKRKQARFWSLETLGAEDEWVRIILFD
jgi:hypothetical protein